MHLRSLCLAVAAGICCQFSPVLAFADEPATQVVPDALDKYVGLPEKVFAWDLQRVHHLDTGVVYDVELTSQHWQGIVWKHNLLIHEPKKLAHPKHVLLFITGGKNGRRPGPGELLMGMQLAELAQARVAMLFQVPNQPLFEGRTEDDLITETWLRYLETGDETWPLLFPMVKSAVKAMDAVEQIAKEKWDGQIEGFVVTGGSKRGWTSWLTPATDKRVVATAPMVIDVLNFRPQMKYQLETWGKYSEQIHDYSSKGLIKEGEESPREARLREMMDPYSYRERLTLPKLLVNGTNDRYWVVDATSLYWDDLRGPKYALQVPNAGHGLDGGRELALSTVAAFFRHAASKSEWPELAWEFREECGQLLLDVSSSVPPAAARLWVARSDTKDFREARWDSQALSINGDNAYRGVVDRPGTGHIARYAELQFEVDGTPFSLCTLIRRD